MPLVCLALKCWLPAALATCRMEARMEIQPGITWAIAASPGDGQAVRFSLSPKGQLLARAAGYRPLGSRGRLQASATAGEKRMLEVKDLSCGLHPISMPPFTLST